MGILSFNAGRDWFWRTAFCCLVIFFIHAFKTNSFAQSPTFDVLSDSSMGVHCPNASCDRSGCFSRTFPPGNLSQRFPYDVFRMYYYDRPYNPDHVSQRFYGHEFDSNLPWQSYSNQIFADVFEQTERDLINQQQGIYGPSLSTESAVQQIMRDKNLEYVDWNIHRESRMNWQHAQNEVEQQESQIKNVSQPDRLRSNDR